MIASSPTWLERLRRAKGPVAGRIVLHAFVVGTLVGLVACVFYALLQTAEHVFLELVAGYRPLRPAGEHVVDLGFSAPERPLWVLALLPALGGLGAGLLISKLAPEAAGGGGDAYIAAFHRKGGNIRRRVAWVKMLATACTLGSGGSGGREGPTMQIGAAVASQIARAIRATPREQRMLLVAGTAAGLSAIFGTPLGAALLATEVLYRDDFESDALIPAVLASVTAYSIFILVFPSSGPLFAHAVRYPFEPRYLPLYAAFAAVVCGAAALFVRTLHAARRYFNALRVAPWIRPAIGGLAVGVLATAWIGLVNPRLGLGGRGIGILGSGYGAAQVAISGAPWLPGGWWGGGLLLLLGILKIFATSLTLGSGGSGGDFGPSLAMGALIGGAFGRAAQLLISPAIDPGAFALVGMGTFYGGLAHAPVSSLVMVCEMAGTYDLLVPLMMCEGLAYVLLRRVSLYPRQPTSRFHSPMHAGEETLDVLKRLFVRNARIQRGEIARVRRNSPLRDIVDAMARAPDGQDTLPVVDGDGALVGMVNGDILRGYSRDGGLDGLVLAADIMAPPATVRESDDLKTAVDRLLEAGVRELPVVDEGGAIVGMLDEAEVSRAYREYIEHLREGTPTSGILLSKP